MLQLIAHTPFPARASRVLRDARWYASLYAIVRVCAGIRKEYALTVVLEGDERVRELNRVYRGHDKTTDVLSFTYPPLMPQEPVTGEVIISVPQAVRQAKRYTTSFAQEMTRLLIHGFLHVHGFDHIREKDRAIMRPLERRVMYRAKKEEIL